MKRLLALISFTLVLAAAPAFASEPAHEGSEAGGHAEAGDPYLGWKIANFVLLAGGLGYLIRKHAGGFFAGRSAEIRKGLEESARLKGEAEARYAEMDRRLANLGADIDNLRASAKREFEAEAGRLRGEAERAVAKVEAQALQDIESAAKNARNELRAYAARLAVSVAERKIRDRLNPETDRVLVNAMLQDLAQRPSERAPRAS